MDNTEEVVAVTQEEDPDVTAHRPKPGPHQTRALTTKITLPRENWALVRDPGDLRRADKRVFLKAMDAAGANLATSQLSMTALGAAQDALLIRFVVEWSLKGADDEPLPIAVESLEDVHQDLLGPIEQHIAPVMQDLMGGGAAPGPNPS